MEQGLSVLLPRSPAKAKTRRENAACGRDPKAPTFRPGLS